MISDKASTVLGTIGTVCWCVQLLPQIYYNYKRKNCEGFPPSMMFLWAICGIPFAIYTISSRANLAVQVQPCLFLLFCSISWMQTLYYPPVQMPVRKMIAIYAVFVAVTVGCDVGFTLWFRRLHDHGTTWPTLMAGIIASVLLALGLIPPYLELAKRKGRVIGINFLFLFIDFMGATLSMLSVVVGNMDIMGIVLYCVCMALELGIFSSHIIWCIRFKWFGKGGAEELDQDDEVAVESNMDGEEKHANVIGEGDRVSIEDDSVAELQEKRQGEEV